MPHHPHATRVALLDLLALLEPFTLLAIGPRAGRGRDPDPQLAVHALTPDPRSGAAAFFGIRAPRRSVAVAVSLLGVARPLPDDVIGEPRGRCGPVPSDGTELRIDLVVDRRAGHRSRIRTERRDGTGPATEEVVEDDTGTGLVIDAMHRALELPSPGPPPPCREALTGLWSHRLLGALALGAPVDWELAAALHPAAPTTACTPVPTMAQPPVSPEALADAGRRADEDLTWADLRRLVVAGDILAPDLSAEEAAWMDTTMFARWWDQSTPSAGSVERALRASGSGALAGYRRVVRHSR